MFFLMCVIGWIYETVLEVFVYHWGFSNRGAMFGPWLPIYGIGGILFVGSCYPIVKSKAHIILRILGVFLATMLIATAVELAASYYLEATRGEWLWDYTRYAINFQGRIALSTSIRFGLCGLLGMFVVYPLVEKFCDRISKKTLHVIAGITCAMFVADIILCQLFR